jgi:hypothetical protein
VGEVKVLSKITVLSSPSYCNSGVLGKWLHPATQDYTIFKIVLLQNVLPQNVLAYKTSCLHNILSQKVQLQNVLPTKRPFHKTSPATKCPHHKTFFLQNILAYKTSLPTKHPSTKCPPPYKISTCSQQHLVYTNAYFLFPNIHL